MKRTICMTMFSACLLTGNAQIMIPDGTKIRIRLDQMISSATAEQGQAVELEVAENVIIDDVVAIPEGARVTGTVTEAHEKRRMGRAGKLDFSIDRVRASDGEWVPLRYTLQKKNGESHAVRTGIITAGVAVAFWPAAPVMLLMKGKDITINKGVTFDVFTDTAHMVGANRANATTLENSRPLPGMSQVSAMLAITSSVSGADIDIDGVFVGNTPTTLQIGPGTHQITVRVGPQSWNRTVQITGGSTVSLNATFETLQTGSLNR